jgi:hypothetical protein
MECPVHEIAKRRKRGDPSYCQQWFLAQKASALLHERAARHRDLLRGDNMRHVSDDGWLRYYMSVAANVLPPS